MRLSGTRSVIPDARRGGPPVKRWSQRPPRSTAGRLLWRAAAAVLVFVATTTSVVALTLTLPPDAGAPTGTATVVPLSVDDAAGMLGTDILITYDPAVALATRVSRTSLSSGQSMNANLSQPGTIRISLYGSMPLSGGGVLLEIAFDSVGPAGARTALDLVSASVNEGGIPAALEDGSYCVRGEAGEVQALRLAPDAPGSTRVILQWETDPYGETYNVYRATEPDLRDLACFLPGLPGPPAADDGSAPEVGFAFFYVMSAVNCRGESGLGRGSSGAERLPATPCP